MKVLTPRMHGYLDLVVVAVFALAPSLLGFTTGPARLSYILAVVHLVLTICTRFSTDSRKFVPFAIHGALELIVSVSLLALPFLLAFADQPAARNFFFAAAVVIFAVWLITDYKAPSRGMA